MNKWLRNILSVSVAIVVLLIASTAFAAAEGEPNDSYSQATGMAVNTVCYGNLSNAYDDDWYRFQITQPGYIKLNFANGANTTSDANYYYVQFMDVNRSDLATTYVKGSQRSVTLPTMGLPPGVYYIYIRGLFELFTGVRQPTA